MRIRIKVHKSQWGDIHKRLCDIAQPRAIVQKEIYFCTETGNLKLQMNMEHIDGQMVTY